MLHKLGRESHVYSMSSKNRPAISVNPGELVLVETEDCFSHKILSQTDTIDENFDFSHINPATGPIRVVGASPGDTLIVNIKNIQLDQRGVVVTCPGWGPAGGLVKECVTETASIVDGHVSFMGGRFDARPMIGVIGTAPAILEVPCGSPGPHGGNLDTVEITQGSRVYLPVFVEGANLALGDVHARMGDGEVCGTGIETRAKVTLTLEIEKSSIDGPIVETETDYFIICSGSSLEEAVKAAVERAVRFIVTWKSIPQEKAYMLLSVVCDLLISQVVNPLVSARVKIPKELL